MPWVLSSMEQRKLPDGAVIARTISGVMYLIILYIIIICLGSLSKSSAESSAHDGWSGSRSSDLTGSVSRFSEWSRRYPSVDWALFSSPMLCLPSFCILSIRLWCSFFLASSSRFSTRWVVIISSEVPPAGVGFHWVGRCGRMPSTWGGIRSLHRLPSCHCTSSRTMLFALWCCITRSGIVYFLRSLDDSSFGNSLINARSPSHHRLAFLFLRPFHWPFPSPRRSVSEGSPLLPSVCWAIDSAGLSSPQRHSPATA